ncbi:MAG: ABC transporter substrate-binding protein [Acidobacteriota bacterium]|nr:ABC transporter substrate-binding protein [Acidobacteriota bacterium]
MSNAVGHYPPDIPRLHARVEEVLSADPDLVLAAPWNDRGFLDLLTRSRIDTVVLDEVVDFAGIREQIVTLGRRLHEEARASEVVGRLDRRLAELDGAVGSVSERPRVLSFSHSVVAGAATTVDALIRRAGGRNAAAELGVSGHKKITVEQLIALDPDLLLLGYDPGEDVEAVLDAYPHLKATRAAREKRVVVLPPRLLTTVTPHLVDGAIALARELHPARMTARREEGGRDS